MIKKLAVILSVLGTSIAGFAIDKNEDNISFHDVLLKKNSEVKDLKDLRMDAEHLRRFRMDLGHIVFDSINKFEKSKKNNFEYYIDSSNKAQYDALNFLLHKKDDERILKPDELILLENAGFNIARRLFSSVNYLGQQCFYMMSSEYYGLGESSRQSSFYFEKIECYFLVRDPVYFLLSNSYRILNEKNKETKSDLKERFIRIFKDADKIKKNNPSMKKDWLDQENKETARKKIKNEMNPHPRYESIKEKEANKKLEQNKENIKEYKNKKLRDWSSITEEWGATPSDIKRIYFEILEIFEEVKVDVKNEIKIMKEIKTKNQTIIKQNNNYRTDEEKQEKFENFVVKTKIFLIEKVEKSKTDDELISFMREKINKVKNKDDVDRLFSNLNDLSLVLDSLKEHCKIFSKELDDFNK